MQNATTKGGTLTYPGWDLRCVKNEYVTAAASVVDLERAVHSRLSELAGRADLGLFAGNRQTDEG